MPVAVAPDDPLASNSPDPSVVAGYVDCLKEALKFLLEKERLPPQHPVVAGLALHLARPGAHNFFRRAPAVPATASARHRRTEHDSPSERRLHQLQNTAPIGKQRLSVRRRPPQNNATVSPLVQSVANRDINGELRLNLQNIVDNLESAINDTEDGEESDDYFSDENETENESNEGEHNAYPPHYDVNDNDLDAEIDTILGDSVLRRELIRLVYQGCDLIATAPLQPPHPCHPSSPQMGATAEPDNPPLPQPI